ncbi:Putative NADH dehydrogenase ubiquinone iron-sulfur protein 4 [Candidatus Phycorickettsia trachydisci]|uniref:NADH dehydrogenase ubiquinone iron-sulfur protein 4 n=1 Tax=Candidatus Phycorickettsia trachydisci TaxID=2115978 RepID=A0A2P1PA85_9RICK|nr:NADH dehydrogenase ubiquinone Fe-S protein 4 [Candidatus Phycorickettsia trachydisci]AVP88169.1 Putative NADH dehydrogenase ubiquinone iron-sulfur protein 4 [Candidatus Phycorickettsia trachydisci]
MKAVILQPSKCVTQSGRAFKKYLLVAVESKEQRYQEIHHQWTGCSDPVAQIKMQFDTLDDAINFAKQNNIEYEYIKATLPKPRKKSYASNFIVST